mmetsp:Transcript_20123/g.36522  ORF Transcript_20123/g.36522 Transcript_20123/m.36522 type:complete len:520 (-) Transcript_20123:50-1609(-)
MSCNDIATELTSLVERGDAHPPQEQGGAGCLKAGRTRNSIFLTVFVGIAVPFFFFILGRVSVVGGLSSSLRHNVSSSSTRSKYRRVQGLGFQIYTGGAPAYINNDTKHHVPNPECIGRFSYGQLVGEDHPHLQCYIGHENATVDVARRIEIMTDAIERAHDLADGDEETLKVFIAPEFYWRGVNGAYLFLDEAPGDPETCGPVCQLLVGMENIVAQKRFENWLFVMGTVIASEELPKADPFDYLFYNFAPLYKGYDPAKHDFRGKRFLVPKRYVSSSDFLTPRRHLDSSIFKELVGEELPEHDKTVYNPHDFDRRRYDYRAWDEYKEELDALGYTMIEYDWLMMDGLSMTVEICLDHQMRTAQSAYNGDMVAGRTTLIPSSSDDGLDYVQIPFYQAQVSLVSSAGMTVMSESLVLTHKGTIFLQDGLSNDTNVMYWNTEDECESGLQFDGGTEAVQRTAFLSVTEVLFEHHTIDDFGKYDLYGSDWKERINETFSTALYPPQITVFGAVDIPDIILDGI